jgi:hypothetical protein
MPGISNTIATIRSCLGSTDLTLSDQLREAAENYSEACRQTNERLGRCEQLLRQGLRAEAIRQAEIDPDLLEMVAELDFEGKDQWDERLTLNDLPSPPAINRKAVEFLNRAYAEEAPLAELLKHHRLLALARAPLSERVQTVRLLAKAEPANAAWSEDVAAFEAARMDEMRTELRQIHQNNDWPRMRALSAEVINGGWQSFLPLELTSDIEREYKRQARLDAEVKFKTHRALLKQAIDALDLTRCHQVRDLMERVCAERQISQDDPLLEPLQPLLDWVSEQDRLAKENRRFEKACRDLTDAIGQKAHPSVLKPLYQAVVDFKRPVPNEVEQVYQDHLRRIGKKRLITAVLFGVALLVMLGAFTGAIVLFMVLGK